MPSGRIKGCYHAIGKPAGLLIVCEGYATGASIHESTGHAVAVAFNAGNLEAVAVALHSKYPALKIIMAADDDYLTTGNPGMTKAKAAAQAVGGLVAVPIFPAGRSDKHTDLNDLHQLAGAGAVKDCIEAAALCGTAKDSADDWPELQSLIVQIDPQDYPTDALPKLIRGAVMEVCGFVKAPVPLVAMSALAALSVAIQAHTDVQRAIKLEGPCGLFLCGIADSGERIAVAAAVELDLPGLEQLPRRLGGRALGRRPEGGPTERVRRVRFRTSQVVDAGPSTLVGAPAYPRLRRL
jgi:putative DNA primase/helicase